MAASKRPPCDWCFRQKKGSVTERLTLIELERFQAKRRPVRVKKTRQIKNLKFRFDSIETEKALIAAFEMPLGKWDFPS
jgi:hypothetical protein